ncbi:MAG: ABC transporter substrate-binding protein [Dehalococcoidales bacterium]|nr:ABC transporter substrate-binding protein [Dehalococcoidales bacterium]
MKKLPLIMMVLILLGGLIVTGCSNATESSSTKTSTAQATTSSPSTTSSVVPSKTTTSAQSPPSSPFKTTTSVPSAGQPKYGGTITYISDMVPYTPIGWPPDIFGTVVTSVQPCLENLLNELPGPKYEPVLAESYEAHPAEKYIDFKIRKGVKFHDGSDLTAEVVRWNYQIKVDANSMGSDNWEKIEVIDDYSVRIHVKQWRNFELKGFSGPMIVSKAAFEKNGVEWMQWHPVGTGPFEFVSYEENTAFKAKKFDNYWQKGKPYIDEVIHLYVTDWTTQKAAMQSGAADFMFCELGKVPADMKALGFEVMTQVQCVFCLTTDSVNEDSPYSKKKVREALEYAIDKEEIAEGLGYGFWKAPYQIIPRDHPAWDPNYKGGTRTYNPEKARQLLAEAGYPEGFKTTLTPAAASLDRNVNVAVQSYLKQVGIEAELEFVEQSKFMEFVFGGWQNRIINDTVASYANYLYTLNLMYSPEYTLLKSLKRPDSYIQKLKAGVASPDIDIPAVRDLCYNLIEEEVFVIPVYEGGKGIAYNDYIKDLGFLTFGDPYYFRWGNVWLDK